ncbi:MAG: hypothetical protein JNM56_35350 [Planctomycetia bacterium]|nr:hypothetical protein [Planctomycetia bacterium]
MTDEPLQLFWKDQLIGRITDAGWSDFPWMSGKVSINQIPPELREAMEYLHREATSDDGVTDWPFPEEFAAGWRMVKPDGTAVEISQPIIDFATGDVDWR